MGYSRIAPHKKHWVFVATFTLYMGALYMGTSKQLRECKTSEEYQEKCMTIKLRRRGTSY